MKKKTEFVLREVCGQKVIIGEGLNAVNFGKLVSLNETAVWLWEQANDGFTIDSLTDALCEEYDVERDEARHDVAEIVGEWQAIGIVEE